MTLQNVVLDSIIEGGILPIRNIINILHVRNLYF